MDPCGTYRLFSGLCRTFDDPVAEARHWRLLAKDRQDELEDLKVAFSDILATSKELEDEMERDLAAMEKREHELRSENERLKGEVDALKVSMSWLPTSRSEERSAHARH